MLLADLQTHACQLLLQLKRRTLGGVGQEKEALVLALQPVHKFGYTGQQTVAVIDNTVHIANEAFLLAKQL